MNKLNEKEIISLMNKKKRRVISEDVEVFRLGNEQYAVCVDTLVESTDIPKGSRLVDISRKSVVASVSDFAAKGIVPRFCIISLTLPKTISKKHVEAISRGFSDACREFKIQLLGGDTNQGKEISIHVVLFGRLKKYVKRKNARIDDLVCTTGAFGYTSAALDIILKKKKSSKIFSKKTKDLFFRPNPRLKFGIKSVKHITSCMDSSDGLSSCLNEMSRQSKKKFVITKYPANDDVREFSKRNRMNLKKLVLDGGEEFELVFTIPPKNLTKILRIARESNIKIFQIGHVAKGNGVFFDDEKESFRIKDKGWEHFR